MIKLDDFKKVDIRIGRVLEVKDHPNADKLYVVMVDWGEGPKQLVAGIKNSYAKEALADKQVVVVVNLEPAVLRGVESQGMILAASDENGIVVLTTDKPVKIGTVVK